MSPQADATCLVLLQDDVDLLALLPFQKMLQLALEPLLVGPSDVTGQKGPTACQPGVTVAESHAIWGSHDTGHLAGRLHAGSELHEGLRAGRVVHSGVKQALHMLECDVCCYTCIG